MVEVAHVRPKRNRWLWLIPLLSLLLAFTLGAQFWLHQGVPITLQFKNGHGVQPGDALKYRGITVGKVESVLLQDAQLNAIDMVIRLTPEARHIAKTGSLFWVNRPQLGLGGISGLDALAGARYIQVLPGKGSANYRFIGLEAVPLNADLEPGGIEVTLQASRLAGLSEGAPIRYRQVIIGKIIALGLSSDASAVEAQAYIQPKYINLVRENAHFWQSGGISATGGLSGFSLKIDSLANAVLGGVEMAIPQEAGRPVHQGHRFPLYAQANQDWLQWKPEIALGSPLLPTSAHTPMLARAVLRWHEKAYGLVETDEQQSGWVIRYQQGWLGPSNLLSVPDKALEEGGQLEVAGASITISTRSEEPVKTLRWVASGEASGWEKSHTRIPLGPEDIVIVGDHQIAHRSVSASRLQVEDKLWRIDAMVSFDARWHGAAVLAAVDGKLLGVILVAEDAPTEVVLLKTDPMGVLINQDNAQ